MVTHLAGKYVFFIHGHTLAEHHFVPAYLRPASAFGAHLTSRERLLRSWKKLSRIWDMLQPTTKQALILLVAACVASVLPTARGTSHLMFDASLPVSVNSTGCGESVLCLRTPDGCVPENDPSCLFVSLNPTSMESDSFDLFVGLRGVSAGNIALGLTNDSSEDISQLFVCGNGNNSTFFFVTRDRDNGNGTLTPNERNVTEIRGSVTDSLIECNFVIPNVNTTNKGEMMDGTTAVVLLGNGTGTNSSMVNDFNIVMNFGRVNLTRADGTITMETLDINREGCGMTKICVESPDECDPQSDPACLFTSVALQMPGAGPDFNLSVELDGNGGYIGMGLTENSSVGISTLYLCGINISDSDNFFFLTLDRNNSDGTTSPSTAEVDDLRYAVMGTSIQCSFTVPNANMALTREGTVSTVGSVLLGNGTVAENGSLNPFGVVVEQRVNFTTPNVTTPDVTTPMLNINRDGCDETIVCLEEPDNCNPETDDGCLFASIDVTSTEPITATVRLSGNSSGYIAMGVTPNISEGTTLLFACGQNISGMFFFRVANLNNTDGSILEDDREVANIGTVEGTSIQCEFNFTNLEPRQILETGLTTVVLGNGPVIGNDTLGPFNELPMFLLDFSNSLGTPGGNAGTTKQGNAMVILLTVLTVLGLLCF
ncbi:uncharacterized protein LOC133567923 isoform X2 [Nerophis ophidion]|uniref:uncharacterized protein LOC133567923 isoform X2 n=1 Tax=Nerophis ophidion TaxID=159077 RepID=UPI002ADF867C|nr:uncharacterized protein LOC133567923 isoform X2 [Nerophis ophidion]